MCIRDRLYYAEKYCDKRVLDRVINLIPDLGSKALWSLIPFFCRLRVVPHFSSEIVERAKRERAWISPHARKGDTRQVERKMRDYRQSPSFWSFTAEWFWSVKFVSPSKSIKFLLSLSSLLAAYRLFSRGAIFTRARVSLALLERLRFMFTPNGKREFVLRDQVFPLFFVYCLLLLHKNK